MKRKSILADPLLYILAAALWILSSVSSSAWAQLKKLNVGYSAISGDQLPAWIAKETRIFEKNGLDVPLIYFTGGRPGGFAPVSRPGPLKQGVALRRGQRPCRVAALRGWRRRGHTRHL